MADNVYSTAIRAYGQAAQMNRKGGTPNEDSVTTGQQARISTPQGPSFESRLEMSQPSEAPITTGKPSFPELLDHAVNRALDVNYKGEETSINTLAKRAELHEMVTAVSNAELTLNTVVAVRDRVISAYQDIIKMPI